MVGTLVNVLAILAGSLAGRFLLPPLPSRMRQTVTAGVGLAVVLIGMGMALEVENVLILILSLALGAATGEALGVGAALEGIGNRLREAVPESSRVGEAFVTATLIFCVGPMAIMGAIQSGVQGDHSTLFAKSMLDGVTSVVLSSTLGIGVMISAVPVLLYQGGIALAGSHVAALLTADMITAMTACGGLLIVALGMNMLEITSLRVANLLPGLLYAPLFTAVLQLLPGIIAMQ